MSPLHYKYSYSPGPCYLFLHGFLGEMHQWDAIIDLVFSDKCLLRVDLPGHGRSAVVEEYNLDQVAHQVNNLLSQLEIEAVHVIGHSMGGYLGSAFAKAYPTQTLSLTLINSTTQADSPERLVMRQRSLKLIERYKNAYINMAITNLFTNDEREEFSDQIDQMKHQAKDMSQQAAKAAIIAMRDRPSYQEALINSNFPIYHIAGVTDGVIPVELIRKDSAVLQSKLDLLNSGHMSILTHVEEVGRLLEKLD